MARRWLTGRQDLFIKYYLTNGNATLSAKMAGYTIKNAGKVGPRLVGNRRIQAAIAEARKTTLSYLDATKERTITELARLAFADTPELQSTRLAHKDEKIKVSAYAKTEALKVLAKYHDLEKGAAIDESTTRNKIEYGYSLKDLEEVNKKGGGDES